MLSMMMELADKHDGLFVLVCFLIFVFLYGLQATVGMIAIAFINRNKPDCTDCYDDDDEEDIEEINVEELGEEDLEAEEDDDNEHPHHPKTHT